MDPNGEIALFDFLFKQDSRIPLDHKIYIDSIDPTRYLTYGELAEKSLQCAAAYKHRFGLQRGDVIAVCSPNDIRCPIFFFGAIAAGCVITLLDHSATSTPKDILTELTTAKPKLFIMHQSQEDFAFDAAKKAGLTEENILLLQDNKTLQDNSYPHLLTADDILLSHDATTKPYAYNKYDLLNTPFCLYFTSGSTGNRKACMIKQNALVCMLRYVSKSLPIGCLSTITTSGFSYGSSLVVHFMFAVYFGISVYIYRGGKNAFEDICRITDKYKINLLMLSPHLATVFVRKSEIRHKYNLSSLKKIYVGGSHMDMTLLKLSEQEFGFPYTNSFAMTECVGVFEQTDEWALIGSVGKLCYGMSARIVDQDGNDVPLGEPGELRLKGPMTAIGYYGNEKETAKLFDEHGYLRTGDMFRMDQDGHFYYITRYKDLIKYHRFHIYPIEIEEVLFKHPSVMDCAVVGVYSEQEAVELPRAYIILVEQEQNKENVLQDILDYVHSQVHDSRKLRGGIYQLASFPRTASGKIKRRELVAMANQEKYMTVTLQR
ncbi:acetyl-CoA synthetase-like protein [Rhizopus microsporus ATCC 52813]|uniref:Acetyl-CoA synthetase-like protein n=1 Tax=Rhizopus microsporus ATCC 52813 TaxID=1340429 RepID=A0A2G4SZ47_RHIZD|nr:acetyl-CoA synthetase-like protein [Rhizopus microsporus ATCC 52813]PHZ13676.1 acetyl-CoA synthetase-like protein [Rhizopus microsporus ATCC 52813]